jgi:flagellar biosynthesis anti-sigma factor FlgM
MRAGRQKMRIDLNTVRVEGPTSGAAVRNSSRVETGAQADAGVAGVAHFSAELGRVATLAAEVARQPEIRQDRVSALQQAIQAGTYQVAAGHTAEAILSVIEARQAA